MPVEIIDTAGKLLQLKVRRMFNKADYDRIIEIAKEAIEREGKVHARLFSKHSKAGSGAQTGET